jgi:hypothetical protein
MPRIELSERTVERLDALRTDEESYDDLVSELVSIYEAEERSMATGPDESG